MAGKTQFAERKVLDAEFGASSLGAPATWYVGLFTAAPSDAGGGTEVATGSYARVGVTNNSTQWPAATGTSPSAKTHANAITFPVPSANWGTVTHFGLFDASTAGNLWYWAALTTAKTINNGDSAPSFAAGALVVNED